MAKIIDYKFIIDELNKKLTKTDYNFINLMKIITYSDLKHLCNCIDNREYLSLYKEKTHLGSNSCAVLFSKAIPIIYSNNEIKQYFLDLLVNKFNSETTWVEPLKGNLFKEFTGYSFYSYQKRNFYLGFIYQDAYSQFEKDYFYPESFKNKTLYLINNNLPLGKNRDEFQIKYNIKGISYLVYLDVYIIDKIGEIKFQQYLHNIINKFLESLPIQNINTVSNDRILDYIFNYHWMFKMHIDDFLSGRRKNKPKHYRLHQMLLKEMFPYVIGNYKSKSNRYAVYKFLEFNIDEQNYYEKLSDTIDRQKIALKLMVSSDDKDKKLPNGNSFNNIYNYIDRYFSLIKNTKRKVPRKNTVLSELLNTIKDESVLKDLKYSTKFSNSRSNIMNYIENKIIEIKQYFFNHNADELNSSKDTWIIYYPVKENFYSNTIDFSKLPNSYMKDEVKIYIRNLYHKVVKYKTSKSYSLIIKMLIYINNKFQVEKSMEIEEWHILSYLHYLESDLKYKPSTVSQSLYTANDFFKALIDTNYKYKPIKNPTLNIKLSNIEEHISPTPYIPEDILIFLDNHIDELKQKDISLIYKLLMETGWRFGDIRVLKSKDICIIPNNTEVASIAVSSPKTKKARISRGLGDILEDVISIELYNEIQNYINETKVIRKIYNIDTVFYCIANGTVSAYKSQTFNNALNKLCKKYGIKSIDERFWNISSKQTRKTVAVSLVSAGASVSAVQKKLGHVTTKTTEKIYAEVQRKKIGELNNEFFQKKFNIYMDEDKLKLFTEEERKILYIDFCLNRRNVELGKCSKHQSEGRCSTIGHTSCAKCPKLCTGKAYLPKWISLMNDSKLLIEEFIRTYKEHNICEDEYEEYIEYKQEKTLYLHYKKIVDILEGDTNE